MNRKQLDTSVEKILDKRELELDDEEFFSFFQKFLDVSSKDEHKTVFKKDLYQAINNVTVHGLFDKYNLNINFNKNFTAIIGPNGIGKSTILKLISFIYCANEKSLIFSNTFLYIPWASIEINEEFCVRKRMRNHLLPNEKKNFIYFEIINLKNKTKVAINIPDNNLENQFKEILRLKCCISHCFSIKSNLYYDYPLSNLKDELNYISLDYNVDTYQIQFKINNAFIFNLGNIEKALKQNFENFIFPQSYKEKLNDLSVFYNKIGGENAKRINKIVNSCSYCEDGKYVDFLDKKNGTGICLVVLYYRQMLKLKLLKEVFDSLYMQEQVTSKVLCFSKLSSSYKKDLIMNKSFDKSIMKKNFIYIGWSFSNDEKLLNLDYLSFGEKRIFNLIINLIFNDEKLYILDEPENALHIEWQEKLIHIFETINNKLKRECQFICATHSPFIGDGDESVFTVPEIFDFKNENN